MDVGAAAELTPAVELRGISKRFGRVLACDSVDLRLWHGHVHGIVGENGAGKSTLMKVLIGLVMPDEGEVLVDGRAVRIPDPITAASLGIAMVHQHLSLVEALTVWENVALGDPGRFDARRMRRRVGEIAEQYGLGVDPDARVADLSAGMRQRVELVKCLRRDPSVLILDEPTSVLTNEESASFFEVLRGVVDREGKAVALVSHKLPEVLHATDELTVMRAGAVIDHRRTAGADAADLARAMVGHPVVLRAERAALGLTVGEEVDHGTPGAVALSVRGAVLHGPGGRHVLDGLDLDVRAGEIVGLAGVDGNGQRPLADVLSSLARLAAGSVEVRGRAVPTGVAGAMARAGVAVIPEDRHDSGCVLGFSVAENLFMSEPERVARHHMIDADAMREAAQELIERYDITCDGPDAPMGSLSGGNQQRVVVARELSHDPVVLVAAHPTRGLDVGAVEEISERIEEAAAAGVAVLLISSELDELIDLADRVAVIHRGRVVGELTRGEFDVTRIGLLMTGNAA